MHTWLVNDLSELVERNFNSRVYKPIIMFLMIQLKNIFFFDYAKRSLFSFHLQCFVQFFFFGYHKISLAHYQDDQEFYSSIQNTEAVFFLIHGPWRKNTCPSNLGKMPKLI